MSTALRLLSASLWKKLLAEAFDTWENFQGMLRRIPPDIGASEEPGVLLIDAADRLEYSRLAGRVDKRSYH
jgi:hypothetical protein